MVCEGDRRRLSTLVAVSALPNDVPSGSCGTDCTSVSGGITLYVQSGDNTNVVYLQCQVIDVVRQTLLKVESNADNGVSEIEFVDTQDTDCGEKAADTSGFPQEIRGIESQASPQGGNGISNGALLAIAVGAFFIAVLALLIVQRRRHTGDGIAYISTVEDKDDDLQSVMTPDTGCDSRQSPFKNSPDREATFAALPSTPEREVILDSERAPIAQFFPALLDASNKSPNNAVSANSISDSSPLFAVRVPFFARFWNQRSREIDRLNGHNTLAFCVCSLFI